MEYPYVLLLMLLSALAGVLIGYGAKKGRTYEIGVDFGGQAPPKSAPTEPPRYTEIKLKPKEPTLADLARERAALVRRLEVEKRLPECLDKCYRAIDEAADLGASSVDIDFTLDGSWWPDLKAEIVSHLKDQGFPVHCDLAHVFRSNFTLTVKILH